MKKDNKNKLFERLAQADYALFAEGSVPWPMIFPGYHSRVARTSYEGIIVIVEIYEKGINVRMTAREEISSLPYYSFNYNVTRTNSEFPGHRGFGYLITDVSEKWGIKISEQMHLDHFVYYRHEPEFQTFLIGIGRFSGKRLLIFEFPD